MRFSPLFWPIKLKGDTIFILDETLLPHKIVYIKAKTYQEACRAIKEMKTRAVGQVILIMYVMLLEIRRNKNQQGLPRHLEKVAAAVTSSRATLPFRMLTDMVLGWVKSGVAAEQMIAGFLDSLKASRIKQAEEASRLIKDGDVILTHCNVSGLMPLIGEFCRRQNKRVSFFVTETRPYLQGVRLTAWELKRQGFDTTVISDGMVAQVMSEGRVDKVIVGADHLAQNGDIANKVGTYQIAILARHFKIPFYVLCPPSSRAKTGKEIKIEIRPQEELLEFCGVRIGPAGVKGHYPAFDVTPRGLITKLIPLRIGHAG